MRAWMPLFGLGVLGVVLSAPGLADERALFGPPPLGREKQSESWLSRYEAPWARGYPLDEPAQPLAAGPADMRASLTGREDAAPRRLPDIARPGGADASAPAPLRTGVAPRPALEEPPVPVPADPGYTMVEDASGGEPPQCPPAKGLLYGIGGRSWSEWTARSYGCSGGCGRVRCEPCRLLDLRGLRCRRIEVGGWLDQGVTLNAADPLNRFNGPVTFNDRHGEYQMNQLYLFAERATNTEVYGVDVGGRVDVLYGTDHRFTVANGLEDKWNLGERFYGLSVPQAYLDVAWNDLVVRMGHFHTILGYESAMAPDNFFYSHTYAMQYGEPFTHTGALGMYHLNDRWCITGGFHRGWNQWEDNNDQLGFLGGLKWTSADKRTSLAFALTSSNEDAAGDNNRTVYSVVYQARLADRLKYVMQHDLGYEDDGYARQGLPAEDAAWYGVVNYLFWELTPRWTVGFRHEWFRDEDGVRVTHLNSTGGPPKGMQLGGVPRDFQQLSVGLNWRPSANLILRTECRWDWTVPRVAAAGGPFNDSQDRDQFLWGTDLIVRF